MDNLEILIFLSLCQVWKEWRMFMPRRIIYKIKRVPRSRSIVFRFIILPIIIIAFLIVTLGVYTFYNANMIMRMAPKQLDDITNNILPAYSIASFQTFGGVTPLSGWYFPAKKTPVSTVILVHSQGNNRLQFDVDTASIYDFFVNNGFNVLSFDLRHSGNSGGNLSTFGYAEWSDVIAAINYVRKVSSTKDVVLFGFGSGVSACILAMEKLPASAQEQANKDINVLKVDFNRTYIRGLILDSPSLSSDDYVQDVCRSSIFLGKAIGQFTIPYAVRMSAETGGATNLAAMIARTQLPVHMIYKVPSKQSDNDKTVAFVTERQRLFPALTTGYSITSDDPSQSVFSYDKDAYLASIGDYLTRFIH